MARWFHSIAFIALFDVSINAQDTFSILGFDSLTREVGAAGASCVDLTNSGETDHFIAEIFPDSGAIASQAYYLKFNQAVARARFRAGDSPAQLLAFMQANDWQNNSSIRQYGAIRFGDSTAAFTGSNCTSYASHRVGPNYSIQGNILLGPAILDSMESKFRNTKGDLACKLMAAMQGAKEKGADSRCMSNNSSSLFAFLKVSHPSDQFGSPSFLVSLHTAHGDSIEPIDSLQVLFDFFHTPCSTLTTNMAGSSVIHPVIFPNPATGKVNVNGYGQLTITNLNGTVMYREKVTGSLEVDPSGWPGGVYFCRMEGLAGTRSYKLVVR